MNFHDMQAKNNQNNNTKPSNARLIKKMKTELEPSTNINRGLKKASGYNKPPQNSFNFLGTTYNREELETLLKENSSGVKIEWLIEILTKGFKGSSKNFPKESIKITSKLEFIKIIINTMDNILLDLDSQFQSNRKDKTEANAFLEIILNSLKETHDDFVDKLGRCISIGEKNKELSTKTYFFKRIISWAIIFSLVNKFDPPYNLFKPSESEANESFNALVQTIKKDLKTSVNKNGKNDELHFKFSDNRGAEHGGNASNFFTFDERADTTKEGYTTFKELWEGNKQTLVSHMSKAILDALGKRKPLKIKTAMNAVTSLSLVCQFRALTVASTIKKLIEAGFLQEVRTFFDAIGGWGDREIGILSYFAAVQEDLGYPLNNKYAIVSVDANPNLVKAFEEIYKHYAKLHSLDSVSYLAINSEIQRIENDKVMNQFNGKPADLSISSPPYYNSKKSRVIEGYPEHRDCEGKTKQSSQYKTEKEWAEQFFLPYLRKLFDLSRISMINVPLDAESSQLLLKISEKNENFLFTGSKVRESVEQMAKKTLFPYYKYIKGSMEEYQKAIGLDLKIICLSVYYAGTTVPEAYYGIQVRVPFLLLTEPAFKLNNTIKHNQPEDYIEENSNNKEDFMEIEVPSESKETLLSVVPQTFFFKSTKITKLNVSNTDEKQFSNKN